MMLAKYFIFCCLGIVLLAEERLAYVVNGKPQFVNNNNRLTNRGSTQSHSFILLGATGDLAKREIYPALWSLYRDQLLPNNTHIYGYARSNRTVVEIRKSVEPFVSVKPNETRLYEDFWTINSYITGTKNQKQDYEDIGRYLDQSEFSSNGGNRIFYMALPPAAFTSTATHIKNGAMAKRGWTRIVIEKPFGRDSESYEKLSKDLSALFTEDQIFRMDHFLGYEMVQNLLTLRFANRIFQSLWSKDNIAAIKIDLKENFGIEGRGSFFDDNGIIRDVMQNHLLQIMSLIAMEEPKSTHSNDVRDAKVALLKKTKEIVSNNVVVGQYIANPGSKDPRERIGYLEEPTIINKQSTTPTFALTVLEIDNERWRGVPFIIRAGKGLDVNKTEVIIQYKNVDGDLFNRQTERNEVTIRIKETEALQVKIMSKIVGINKNIEKIKFDFDYEEQCKSENNPEAYQRLLLDVFNGSQLNFVRNDELKEAWRIFTPILHQLENKNNNIRPINYKFGSTGPQEADAMERRNNFLQS